MVRIGTLCGRSAVEAGGQRACRADERVSPTTLRTTVRCIQLPFSQWISRMIDAVTEPPRSSGGSTSQV